MKGRLVTGPTTAAWLDLSEGVPGRSADPSTPAPIHVETELQRLVSQRLGPTPHGDTLPGRQRGSRSLRARMQRKESIAGAFDSPQSFVYVSDAVSHKRT
jgi:hypothetical protein